MAAFILSACGGDNLTSTQKQWTKNWCELHEHLDEYKNPDGWDRCVDDAKKDAPPADELDRLGMPKQGTPAADEFYVVSDELMGAVVGEAVK